MNRWMVFNDVYSYQPTGYVYAPEGVNRLIGESTSIIAPASFHGGAWIWRRIYLRNRTEPPYHWQDVGWLYTTDGGSREFVNSWHNPNVEVSTR